MELDDPASAPAEPNATARTTRLKVWSEAGLVLVQVGDGGGITLAPSLAMELAAALVKHSRRAGFHPALAS